MSTRRSEEHGYSTTASFTIHQKMLDKTCNVKVFPIYGKQLYTTRDIFIYSKRPLIADTVALYSKRQVHVILISIARDVLKY
jgi:hypothetical protein